MAGRTVLHYRVEDRLGAGGMTGRQIFHAAETRGPGR